METIIINYTAQTHDAAHSAIFYSLAANYYQCIRDNSPYAEYYLQCAKELADPVPASAETNI